jgi:S-adenosylmethionine-diacylglycerol 3-amino-3-carboxypropyl transferase
MVVEKLSKTWFNLVHGRNLVYNQCWEDPRLDRVALNLSSSDRVVVITSAGCNALDYALGGAGHVHAVDMNSRQNALLELKQAGVKSLDYQNFFQLFGRGSHPDWKSLYANKLRPLLGEETQKFWDRKRDFFLGNGRRKSFYFRGTSGTFAFIVNYYIDRVAKVRDGVNAILAATSIEQQRDIFVQYKLAESLWRPFIRWAMRRDMTLALLGVPRAQRKQIDEQYPGGILQFVMDRVEAVFTRLPLHDNYFWRVYLSGEYTPHCCPEYLTEAGYQQLRAGAVDQVSTHTNSVLGFLEESQYPISRFILLDHMDWLSRDPALRILTKEWQAIVNKAAPGSRVLWRSAGLRGDFINGIKVQTGGQTKTLSQILEYQTALATELHAKDRVHTYGSFCIADIKA